MEQNLGGMQKFDQTLTEILQHVRCQGRIQVEQAAPMLLSGEAGTADSARVYLSAEASGPPGSTSSSSIRALKTRDQVNAFSGN